jgi:hypothetical protein
MPPLGIETIAGRIIQTGIVRPVRILCNTDSPAQRVERRHPLISRLIAVGHSAARITRLRHCPVRGRGRKQPAQRIVTIGRRIPKPVTGPIDKSRWIRRRNPSQRIVRRRSRRISSRTLVLVCLNRPPQSVVLGHRLDGLVPRGALILVHLRLRSARIAEARVRLRRGARSPHRLGQPVKRIARIGKRVRNRVLIGHLGWLKRGLILGEIGRADISHHLGRAHMGRIPISECLGGPVKIRASYRAARRVVGKRLLRLRP